MVVEHDLVEPVVLLDQDGKVAHLVVRCELGRPADVALAVGRALDELAELVAIALGPAHVPAALHHQQLGRLGPEIEPVAVQDAAVDDEIVALADRAGRRTRVSSVPAPLAHVHQLVGLRVPVEVRVLLVGLDVEHRDVLIEQQRHPVERRAAALLHLRGAEVPMPERLVGIGLVFRLPEPPDRLHRRGRMDVIEQRRGPVNPSCPIELLGVDAAVGLPEGDVPLPRDWPRCGRSACVSLRDSRAAPAPARSPRTAP